MAGSIRGLQPTQETAERSLEVQTESRIAIISGPAARQRSLTRRLTMYRAFSGLTGLRGSPRKNEDEVILVSAVEQEGSDYRYQTMF
ncbi:UNVERIFIED_CONTAM: hypothetical protein Sradi_4235300 [Sesamum radiatum]|uniref:Uncharacterized protein n=1 Tax=Sesamum radiatum TaxID=300843 RepID=A0AAW2P7S7_SESRA